MRKIFIGVFSTVVLVFGLQYCDHTKETRMQLSEDSMLIQKQLDHVGKLIVTEGTFAEVFSYEDSKKMYFDLLSANKKALVVVNAKATVAYDLSQVETRIDQDTKTVYITKIAEPELNIHPDIEYYDIQQDYLNPFGAEDYNVVKDRVTSQLREKIEASSMMSNAENRLISELQKIYLLTESLGWTLTYNKTNISSNDSFQSLLD